MREYCLFIAHLPAGYVISKSLWIKFSSRCQGISQRLFLSAGLIGSVAPDFDLFYFYLMDHRANHHHTYFTHYPIVWFALLGLSLLCLRFFSPKKWAILVTLFCVNALVHLLLDSVVGDIWWLMPFVDQPYALFTVPAKFNPWWLSFLLHWSFLCELLIICIAVWLWLRNGISRLAV